MLWSELKLQLLEKRGRSELFNSRFVFCRFGCCCSLSLSLPFQGGLRNDDDDDECSQCSGWRASVERVLGPHPGLTGKKLKKNVPHVM